MRSEPARAVGPRAPCRRAPCRAEGPGSALTQPPCPAVQQSRQRPAVPLWRISHSRSPAAAARAVPGREAFSPRGAALAPSAAPSLLRQRSPRCPFSSRGAVPGRAAMTATGRPAPPASRSAPPAPPPAGSAGDSARLPPQEAPQPPRRLPLGARRWQVRLPASSRSRRRRRGRGIPGAEGPGGGRDRARPGDGGGRGGGTAGPRGAAVSSFCCRVAFSSAGSPRFRVLRPPSRWLSPDSGRPEDAPGASAASVPAPCGSAPGQCPSPGAHGDAA